MEVILLERIEKLGQMGDVVTVKDGYARNFLLPQNKALRATKDNVARFETDRDQLEKTNLIKRQEAEGLVSQFDGLSIVILRQASEAGQLYGSVSARDIVATLAERNIDLERRQILLDSTIKSLGLTEVRIALHPEVTTSMSVNVARSAAEAEVQEKAIEEDGSLDAYFEDEGRVEQAEAVTETPLSDKVENENMPQGEAAPEETRNVDTEKDDVTPRVE